MSLHVLWPHCACHGRVSRFQFIESNFSVLSSMSNIQLHTQGRGRGTEGEREGERERMIPAWNALGKGWPWLLCQRILKQYGSRTMCGWEMRQLQFVVLSFIFDSCLGFWKFMTLSFNTLPTGFGNHHLPSLWEILPALG